MNVGVLSLVGFGGPVRIVVFGPAASTVTDRVAAPLTLPAASVARTE